MLRDVPLLRAETCVARNGYPALCSRTPERAVRTAWSICLTWGRRRQKVSKILKFGATALVAMLLLGACSAKERAAWINNATFNESSLTEEQQARVCASPVASNYDMCERRKR